MADPITLNADLSQSHPPQIVATKANWSDSWTVRPDLFADELTSALNPTISRAVLRRRFGEGKPIRDKVYGEHAPLDLIDQYVRVMISGLGNWYGIIRDRQDERFGFREKSDGVRVPAGVEHLFAYGLETLLDFEPVHESWVFLDSSNDKQIGRPIPFNAGVIGEEKRPAAGANADPNEGIKGTWVFAADLSDASVRAWNSRRIVEYLLAYFAPQDKDGSNKVPFELDDASQIEALEAFEPVINYEGLTVKAILDRIIDARRGLAYRVSVDEGANKVKLQVISYLDSELTLPSGKTIPANAEQKTLDADQNPYVQRHVSRTVRAERYDQVIARGERRGAVCTLALADSTLTEDWGDDEQTYETAETAAADYSDLSSSDQKRRNAASRDRDELARVFSWFAVPDPWDGKVGDGEGGATNPAFPVLDSAGDPTSTAKSTWRSGLRIETSTPLLAQHRYHGTRIDDDAIDDLTPSGSTPEELPPLAFLQIDTARNAYQHVEKLAQIKDASGQGGREWAADLSIRRDGAGVILTVNGAQQHFVAINNFDKPAADPTDFPTDQALDYNTLIVTVYMLSDHHVEEEHPTSGLPVNDQLRRKVIRVPEAYLDWVPVGTVVAVDSSGQLLKVDTGAFLRDHRDRLKDVARSAFEYYGQDRRILEFAIRSLSTRFDVGWLITEIGGDDQTETVRTVISEASYDLQDGMTSFRTQFVELDEGIFL